MTSVSLKINLKVRGMWFMNLTSFTIFLKSSFSVDLRGSRRKLPQRFYSFLDYANGAILRPVSNKNTLKKKNNA